MTRDITALAQQAVQATRKNKAKGKFRLPRFHIGAAAPGKPFYETVEGTPDITLNLHDGQLETWQSAARIVAMIAGSQGGKTAFGPVWLYREVYGNGEDFAGRGAGDYIAATASYDLFKLKMLPALREFFEHLLKVGRYWSGDKIIELADPVTGKFLAQRADDPMWGRIILRSASSEGGLESTTAKAAWLDEAGQDEFTLDANEAVDRRLTLNEGRKLITTTPYSIGWLKQQIIDRADGVEIDVINFESIANPQFPKAEFERLRRNMPGWRFNMFMRGLFDRPPGMIFSDFKDEYRERGGHKVKPFDLPRSWARYVGVDPGVIHFCHVWLALDTENSTAYVYREGVAERKGTPEQARDLLETAAANGERVALWAVGAKSEIYHRDDFIAAGADGVVEPLYADVESRIDAVIRWLRPMRLFIFDTCTGTLDQLSTYSRELNSQGESTEKIKDKAKYHYVDALGYGIQHVPEYDESELFAIAGINYFDNPSIGNSVY